MWSTIQFFPRNWDYILSFYMGSLTGCMRISGEFLSLFLSYAHIQNIPFNRSMYEAWKHEDRLFNERNSYITSEFLRFFRYIKNSFRSYIFVKTAADDVWLRCYAQTLYSIQFLSVAPIHGHHIQIQMFKRAKRCEYNKKKNKNPLWVVIEYFIACIGYSKISLEKSVLYLKGFYGCILSWRRTKTTNGGK